MSWKAILILFIGVVKNIKKLDMFHECTTPQSYVLSSLILLKYHNNQFIELILEARHCAVYIRLKYKIAIYDHCWSTQTAVKNDCLCDSMDGTGEHYARWNKPGGQGQIPCDLTYEWNLINKTNKQAK